MNLFDYRAELLSRAELPALPARARPTREFRAFTENELDGSGSALRKLHELRCKCLLQCSGSVVLEDFEVEGQIERSRAYQAMLEEAAGRLGFPRPARVEVLRARLRAVWRAGADKRRTVPEGAAREFTSAWLQKARPGRQVRYFVGTLTRRLVRKWMLLSWLRHVLPWFRATQALFRNFYQQKIHPAVWSTGVQHPAELAALLQAQLLPPARLRWIHRQFHSVREKVARLVTHKARRVVQNVRLVVTWPRVRNRAEQYTYLDEYLTAPGPGISSSAGWRMSPLEMNAQFNVAENTVELPIMFAVHLASFPGRLRWVLAHEVSHCVSEHYSHRAAGGCLWFGTARDEENLADKLAYLALGQRPELLERDIRPLMASIPKITANDEHRPPDTRANELGRFNSLRSGQLCHEKKKNNRKETGA
jgi:hypothetical protein